MVAWGDPDHGGDNSQVQQLTSVQQIQATRSAFAAIQILVVTALLSKVKLRQAADL